MKVLLINKFLFPKGGSETYVFKLGAQLEKMGHEVEYFGMEHAGNCVGNTVNAYTSNMDFHGGSLIDKLTYPLKTIYSVEARKQIRRVLEDFQPDVCHLNNFNYQLTPSIILEIVKWRKKAGKPCRILYTAHDYQLVCPNHMCRNPLTLSNCEQCLKGSYHACVKGKCVHGSTLRSLIGAMEARFWKLIGVYRYLDRIICCSAFLKTKLDQNPLLSTKTMVLHNFIDAKEWKDTEKKPYVLYFGRYAEEKGLKTLIEVCRQLPEIPFIFAGNGPMEEDIQSVGNITNVGFQTGDALEKLIREAKFSVHPSEGYENCPFSVMESQMYGTPTIGSRNGGIPELIREGVTGDLFPAGDVKALKEKISLWWEDEELRNRCSENCRHLSFDTATTYTEKLLKEYSGT